MSCYVAHKVGCSVDFHPFAPTFLGSANEIYRHPSCGTVVIYFVDYFNKSESHLKRSASLGNPISAALFLFIITHALLKADVNITVPSSIFMVKQHGHTCVSVVGNESILTKVTNPTPVFGTCKTLTFLGRWGDFFTY